jgi:hypothetical protein
MKLPRDVSGARLADVLCRKWQYQKVHKVGSHIILERPRRLIIVLRFPNMTRCASARFTQSSVPLRVTRASPATLFL